MFDLAFWGIWLLGMTLWSIWYWKVKVPRSRRAGPKYPPTEVLGTLDQATLVLLTQEDLDWWNQQRELMGLKGRQGKQRPMNDEMIHRVLAKAANPHGMLCDCRECLRSRRLRKLDQISRMEARGEELDDYIITLRSKILDDLREGHEVTELKTLDGSTVHISATERNSA